MTQLTKTKTFILAAVASTAALTLAVPTLASAACSDDRAAGTALGAVAGAAIGHSAEGRYHRGGSTIAGALVGAAVGNAIASDSDRCDYAYRDGYRERVYVEPQPYYRDRVYVEPSYGYGYSYNERYYDYRREPHWGHRRDHW